MKTPMKELIEHLFDVEKSGNKLGLNKKESALVQATIKSVSKTIEEEYVGKEEQALIDAWNDANMVTGIDIIETGEQYYKKTFGK